MSEQNSPALWLQIKGLDSLAELAFNLDWSWNHEADPLWEHLDAELWQTPQNPWVILKTVSRDTLESALAEPEFARRLQSLLAANRESYTRAAWFQTKHAGSQLTSVAYFSMEFMLTEALPIYSGGLGNVAGDQLKAASDLGVPVVGVSLLYGQGYFRQNFDRDGNQRVLYPISEPSQLPIRPLRHANGEWIRVQVELPAEKIWLRCWEAYVGRTRLYLLDANDMANTAAARGITGQLYGGDAELRVQQEIVLGIGGTRLLRVLGRHEVCHLNEGHAAFAILERARTYMDEHDCTFELALKVTRAGNIFTTHTAVAAGFDRFDPDLMRKYFSHYAQDKLKISVDALLALGRQNPHDGREPFNMAYLAVHGSNRINGVSKLHGEVSRHIFQPLFPRWPQAQVPIGYVTNGVHVPTWEAAASTALWDTAYGRSRWQAEIPTPAALREVSDEKIHNMRALNRKSLIQCVRKRYVRQLDAAGANSAEGAELFSEDVLTMGFARRFATYKRPNLLLHDPERLMRLLSSSERPVQLIVAGKAHPQDLPGQALIARWNSFIRRPDVRSHVVFLSDYDMLLAQELVRGIDVWINTPRRPWEACGTSGMKVLVNGGLNFSELDGWWAEAYTPDVGWAIGDGEEHGDDAAWDAREAEALYSRLEQEIVPEFYDRGGNGRSKRWLRRIRASMAELTPSFSATRAIQEYTETYYLPAAADFAARTAADSSLAKTLVDWELDLIDHWRSVRIQSANVSAQNGNYVFELTLLPGTFDKDSRRVELYADASSASAPVIEIMTLSNTSAEPDRIETYTSTVSTTRPASDFTMRVVAYHTGAFVPLEANEILWQR